MMSTVNQVEIANNKEKGRFEIRLGNDYAFVDYRWRNEVFELMYIFVPVHYRGKGISEELIKHVLDFALENNLQINVYCSWIAGFVRSHPEYLPLVERHQR